MRVLITGGTGMVGRALQFAIQLSEDIDTDKDDFYFMDSKEYDLRNITDTERLFKENEFDTVIHLAAKVGGLYKNLSANIAMFMDNMRINMNVVEMAHKYNVTRGIFCLSSCIYPNIPVPPAMNENILHDGRPHDSNEGYAYSKRMLEMLCSHYCKEYGREYVCLSPVNMYGPFDNYNIEEAHVVPALLHRFYKYKMNEEDKSLEVYGTGEALRQFLFAPDFANILLRFLYNKEVKEGVYNICSEEEYHIKELVDYLRNIIDIKKQEITYNSSYSDGIIRKTVDNSKFRQLYPDYKFINLEDGLAVTIGWLHDNYKDIRKDNAETATMDI